MQSIRARHYHIVFVDDDELPPIRDFAFVECGDNVWLAIKVSKLLPHVLEDAWATYREMEHREDVNA